MALSGRLGTLTARDIMTERLVVLRETDTIQHAVNLFGDLHISGAPVVNDEGVAVGLLSMSDIIPAVAARVGNSSASPRPQTRDDEWAEIRALFNTGDTSQAAGANELVGTWMSRRLISAVEETSLVELSRLMCDGHWHRLTVVDAQGRLRGIISTMDILAALVAAAEEGT
ncbi:MAG: HPP family protein [Planctomycetales bacterium]